MVPSDTCDGSLTSVTLPCIMLFVLSPSLGGAFDVEGEAVAGGGDEKCTSGTPGTSGKNKVHEMNKPRTLHYY